jgi:hypothetical protein
MLSAEDLFWRQPVVSYPRADFIDDSHQLSLTSFFYLLQEGLCLGF